MELVETTSSPLPAERDAATRGLEIALVPRGENDDFEAAVAALGITSADGVKTLVVKISGGASILVLVPGTRRLDWAKLRSLLEVNKASLVTPEAALELTGYAPGTITPLGSRNVLAVYADERIAGRRIGMGSGSPDHVLVIEADPLLASFGAVLGDITSDLPGPEAGTPERRVAHHPAAASSLPTGKESTAIDSAPRTPDSSPSAGRTT